MTLPVSYTSSSGISSLLSQTSQSTTTTSSYLSSSGSSVLSSDWKAQIKAQIDELLKDIPEGSDGKLSFQDVDDYREKLEDEWDETVKADLEKLGVDTDTELPLKWDSTEGKIVVADSHPDKEVIDKYFEDNPERVEEFKKIIQLGKLTSTSNYTLSSAQLQKQLQVDSMSIWFSDNTDPTSWFEGGGMLMNSTTSNYTGLNLTV